MNFFSKRKLFESSIVSSNENDVSFETTKASDLRYGSLRKCFSCSQIQVLQTNIYKSKRKSICRSVSSDEMERSLPTKLLLKMIDISAIDSKEFKFGYDFENPIIKITQNFHKIQDLDENIDFGEENDNGFKLSANYYSNVSSTSAGDVSSPTDISPSDYYSHELSESVDEDNWETDSNTISCDKTCVPTDAPITICSRPIDATDCLKRNINQKSRNMR